MPRQFLQISWNLDFILFFFLKKIMFMSKQFMLEDQKLELFSLIKDDKE